MTIDAPHPEGPVATSPDPAVRRARDIALASVLGLVALGLAWELWLAPTGSGTWAIKVVPLLFCVAGLLRHRLYTFRWLSLLVWLYALEAMTRGVVETGLSQALALGQLALSLVLFAACAMYVRWRLRQGRRLAEAAAP
ncbi:MAG: DUF2069 domain-containing protein [Betaproteobacteria bacterium]|jgi:uncharacterized membrane protein